VYDQKSDMHKYNVPSEIANYYGKRNIKYNRISQIHR